MSQAPLEMPEKPKKKISLATVLLVLGVLILAGAGAYYFLVIEPENTASVSTNQPSGIPPVTSQSPTSTQQPPLQTDVPSSPGAFGSNASGVQDGPGVPDTPPATGETLPENTATPAGSTPAASAQPEQAGQLTPPTAPANSANSANSAGRNNGFTLEPPIDGIPQTPPPPPLTGLNNQQGNMAAIDAALAESHSPASANAPFVSGSLNFDSVPEDAGSPQDSIITPLFIRDFANYLVTSYNPKTNSSSATLVATNQRYGLGMQGLRYAGDINSGRASVLTYAYSPGMIQALSQLYSDPFMGAMVDATLQPPSGTPIANADAIRMFQFYAREARLIAGSLRTVAATPDLAAKVHVYQRAHQNLARAKDQFTQLQIAYENARDSGAETTALRAKMEDATRQSQSATVDYERERAVFLQQLKQNIQGTASNDDTLLYLAEWVSRRGSSPQAATLAAAQALENMAAMFDAEAAQMR